MVHGQRRHGKPAHEIRETAADRPASAGRFLVESGTSRLALLGGVGVIAALVVATLMMR